MRQKLSDIWTPEPSAETLPKVQQSTPQQTKHILMVSDTYRLLFYHYHKSFLTLFCYSHFLHRSFPMCVFSEWQPAILIWLRNPVDSIPSCDRRGLWLMQANWQSNLTNQKKKDTISIDPKMIGMRVSSMVRPQETKSHKSIVVGQGQNATSVRTMCVATKKFAPRNEAGCDTMQGRRLLLCKSIWVVNKCKIRRKKPIHHIDRLSHLAETTNLLWEAMIRSGAFSEIVVDLWATSVASVNFCIKLSNSWEQVMVIW